MQGMRSMVLGMAAMVVVTACGQGVNKVGADDPQPISLRGETAFNLDDVSAYTEALTAATGGGVQLALAETKDGAADAERSVVEDVRSGSVDIGFVGTRVWPSYKVHDFDALQAPMLIDSYALESQVLGGPIADAMGSDLDALGLVSLGVLEGPLRVPMGHAGPFVKPADFNGATVAYADSAVSEAALKALGATPVAFPRGTSLDGFDGFEGHPSLIMGNGYQDVIRFVTGNLVLWPRPVSAFINKARYAALTSQQQGWLRDAVHASLSAGAQGWSAYDVESIGNACRNGVQFIAASDADIAAMRTALEPVYADLRKDAATNRAIDAITALKTSPGESMSCPIEATASASSAATDTAIDGTWQACPTEADIVAVGGDPGEAHDNAGCSTMTLHRGQFTESGEDAESGAPGTYTIEGDQLTIRRANGEEFAFTWSLYRDQLTLSPPKGAEGVSPAPMRALPFVRQ